MVWQEDEGFRAIPITGTGLRWAGQELQGPARGSVLRAAAELDVVPQLVDGDAPAEQLVLLHFLPVVNLDPFLRLPVTLPIDVSAEVAHSCICFESQASKASCHASHLQLEFSLKLHEKPNGLLLIYGREIQGHFLTFQSQCKHSNTLIFVL